MVKDQQELEESVVITHKKGTPEKDNAKLHNITQKRVKQILRKYKLMS